MRVKPGCLPLVRAHGVMNNNYYIFWYILINNHNNIQFRAHTFILIITMMDYKARKREGACTPPPPNDIPTLIKKN